MRLSGKRSVLYNTSDLIKKDFTGLQESGFLRELCNRLTEIRNNINEMDNPVLLIGTI
jgi:hypothetical protein